MIENQKILLVDDNRDLLQIVQIILKGQGYESILATSINEAITKIKIHKPSLILLDIFISDEDGRIFCSRLKSSKETNYIPIILMSGCENNPGMKACIGADDFMQKPFDYDDLIGKVNKQLLQNHRAWA